MSMTVGIYIFIFHADTNGIKLSDICQFSDLFIFSFFLTSLFFTVYSGLLCYQEVFPNVHNS